MTKTEFTHADLTDEKLLAAGVSAITIECLFPFEDTEDGMVYDWPLREDLLREALKGSADDY